MFAILLVVSAVAAGAFLVLVCLLGIVLTLAWVYLWSWNWPNSVYCQILYLAYQSQLFKKLKEPPELTKENAPKVMPLEKMKERASLEKYSVPYAFNIQVPKDKHEEFKDLENDKSFKRRLQVKFEENISMWPVRDNFDCFKERECPVKYVMDRLGSIFPRGYQEWKDKLSDEALTRFCLHGLGAHRVQVEKQEDGTELYVVRTNALAALPVRKGFARYGGDAYFDKDWKPVKIVDAGREDTSGDSSRNGQPSQPVVTLVHSEHWAEAKFRFRSSLAVLVTLVDHLYAIHLETANIFVTALREQLSPGHCLRRFLTPFTYQTITVNDNCRNNLVSRGSMSTRCFAFTDIGLEMAFAAAGTLVRNGFECDPPILDRVRYVQYLKDQGIDTPFWRDAVQYWQVIKRYVWRYLAYCYEHKGDIFADEELMAFFKQIEFQYRNVMPMAAMGISAPNKELVTCSPHDDEKYYGRVVDAISFFIYTVTASHEHAGSVESYVQDPTFCAFKWIPGHMCGTKQTAIAQALLMSFTSLPKPPLLGSDWSHLFELDPDKSQRVAETWIPDDRKYERIMDPCASFEAFQKELRELADKFTKEEKEVERNNHPYNYPVYVFNPTYLETSVSV